MITIVMFYMNKCWRIHPWISNIWFISTTHRCVFMVLAASSRSDRGRWNRSIADEGPSSSRGLPKRSRVSKVSRVNSAGSVQSWLPAAEKWTSLRSRPTFDGRQTRTLVSSFSVTRRSRSQKYSRRNFRRFDERSRSARLRRSGPEHIALGRSSRRFCANLSSERFDRVLQSSGSKARWLSVRLRLTRLRRRKIRESTRFREHRHTSSVTRDSGKFVVMG